MAVREAIAIKTQKNTEAARAELAAINAKLDLILAALSLLTSQFQSVTNESMRAANIALTQPVGPAKK